MQFTKKLEWPFRVNTQHHPSFLLGWGSLAVQEVLYTLGS